MKLEQLLVKYSGFGKFTFSPSEELKHKCNAPNDKGSVYLIFDISHKNNKLLYIGSSGQRAKDGTLKVRKGGLYDRIVNRYHPNRFGKDIRIKRKKAFPEEMLKSGIDTIEIKWWVTYEGINHDFPTDIKSVLKEKHLKLEASMPKWHQQ
ncbi:hypothetical protein ACIVBQ_002304 [Tenacibaculum discolor]